VEQFFATVTHPTLGLSYTNVGYRPMRELLALLEAHDFTTYICSGGGRDFIRPSPSKCTASPVIGSATTLEYRDGDIYRTKSVEQPIDDGTGKPEHIWMRTGQTAPRGRQRGWGRGDARDRPLRSADQPRRW
jgi:hypothetical protein